MTPDDERLLRRALELAAAARATGHAPYASLLVGPDGRVLIEDHNTVDADNDITAHPELKLALWASRELDRDTAAGTTMYTSCQPCGMCQGAIERSGLGRVVFALSTDQLTALKPPAPPATLRMEGPALPGEAEEPLAGFYV